MKACKHKYKIEETIYTSSGNICVCKKCGLVKPYIPRKNYFYELFKEVWKK